LWEERFGRHFHTIAVQRAALAAGARWYETVGEMPGRDHLRGAAADLDAMLERYWEPRGGLIVTSLDGAPRPDRDLDGAVLLGLLHGRDPVGPTSMLDGRAQATILRLWDLFAEVLPINATLGDDRGPLWGRFRDDGYFGGGAFLMTTLAAAELFYRLAKAIRDGATIECSPDNVDFLARVGLPAEPGRIVPATAEASDEVVAAFVARGDAVMAAVRALTPESGALPEQFDRETGAPASVDDLAWSHGAFITAWAARRRAVA
jgi:glucoamylase